MEAAWHRVSAFVLCRTVSGRVLLTRFSAPGHPDHGKWTMPGGGMDWGESPEQTALRELLEETGLQANLGNVAGVFTHWLTAEESVRRQPGQFVGIVFHGTDVRGELRKEFDSDNTTDAAAWFSAEEIASLPHVALVDFVLRLV